MQINKLIFFGIFLLCSGLLGFGLFLEHYKGIEPCPLCIFQRIAYILIALVALAAAVYSPGKISNYLYCSIISLITIIGAGIAGRQVWLQHLPPDRVPECGPGLDYLLDVFPFTEMLEMVFTGSGECAEVNWQFLSLSIADWSLFCFISILLICLLIVIITKNLNTE